MSDTWTATYQRYGAEYTEEFATLAGAVGFDVHGVENGSHAVVRIIGPDGQLIEGDELREAALHFQLGEEDYDRRRVAKWKPLLGL